MSRIPALLRAAALAVPLFSQEGCAPPTKVEVASTQAEPQVGFLGVKSRENRDGRRGFTYTEAGKADKVGERILEANIVPWKTKTIQISMLAGENSSRIIRIEGIAVGESPGIVIESPMYKAGSRGVFETMTHFEKISREEVKEIQEAVEDWVRSKNLHAIVQFAPEALK